jgi:hypothetical protein
VLCEIDYIYIYIYTFGTEAYDEEKEEAEAFNTERFGRQKFTERYTSFDTSNNESVLFHSELLDFRRKFPSFFRFSFCIKMKYIMQMYWDVTEMYVITFKILN